MALSRATFLRMTLNYEARQNDINKGTQNDFYTMTLSILTLIITQQKDAI